MTISSWLRTPRIRRGLAASAIVLSAGGLILFRAPAGASVPRVLTHELQPLVAGVNSVTFAGPGAHGMVSLSHTNVLAGAGQPLFAEVRIVADRIGDLAQDRAPLSLAVVLDTSGSMEGEKMDQAQNSVIRLIGEMRDDDEITVVRYSDSAEVVQPLARVGDVRGSLIERVRRLTAGGGTAIPSGLSRGLRELSNASSGRVRRVVLVSDGLDATRQEAERLASNSFERGVTVSSLGVGLDFDESYMNGVAHSGHGNFGFVKDGAALSAFLERELKETAATTLEGAEVAFDLPRGVSFVRATGADARIVGDSLHLKIGSLFSGDDRRVIVELTSTLGAGDARSITGHARWTRVRGGSTEAGFSQLTIVASTDAGAVTAGIDGRVFASATSVVASTRQLEATEAYAKGDALRAQAILAESTASLGAAIAVAPPSAAAPLARQAAKYKERAGDFKAAPGSDEGKAAAKAAVQLDSANTSRASF